MKQNTLLIPGVGELYPLVTTFVLYIRLKTLAVFYTVKISGGVTIIQKKWLQAIQTNNKYL